MSLNETVDGEFADRELRLTKSVLFADDEYTNVEALIQCLREAEVEYT